MSLLKTSSFFFYKKRKEKYTIHVEVTSSINDKQIALNIRLINSFLEVIIREKFCELRK